MMPRTPHLIGQNHSEVARQHASTSGGKDGLVFVVMLISVEVFNGPGKNLERAPVPHPHGRQIIRRPGSMGDPFRTRAPGLGANPFPEYPIGAGLKFGTHRLSRITAHIRTPAYFEGFAIEFAWI